MASAPSATDPKYVRWYKDLSMKDLAIVGGKNASLGQMRSQMPGVPVPDGFATTAEAYRIFLHHNALDARIEALLSDLDVKDTRKLRVAGEQVRGWILDAALPPDLATEVVTAYRELCRQDADLARAVGNSTNGELMTVAVRSSATAEDLPDASFAGQQETYLNVSGEDMLLRTVRRVMASLYTDRAIVYRVSHGFKHADVALSVGVQKMVRSDGAASGVLFTLDTESGFRDACLVTSSYGLGELVVQGSVTPDEWLVFKPTLAQSDKLVPIVRRSLGSKRIKMIYNQDRVTADPVVTVNVSRPDSEKFSISDEEVLSLARYGVEIEKAYGRPMDIEWAKDGPTKQLYIVQARPETIFGLDGSKGAVIESYTLAHGAKEGAKVLAAGRAVGSKCATGRVRVILEAKNMGQLKAGEVLVTELTDPDWLPVMRIAAAIVTARGGRVCHAAIVAREIGTPAVVGAANATSDLIDGQLVTVCCSEGDCGLVLEGKVPFDVRKMDISTLPRPTRTKISLIMANPGTAFSLAKMPVTGVGLLRMEFLLSGISFHPLAALNLDKLPPDMRAKMVAASLGAPSPVEHYTRTLSEGIGCIAAAFYPQAVIVRTSDFKSNEYRGLIGGELYEPKEENPMLGWRGAVRYASPQFAGAFALECKAIRRAREDMGLMNIEIMLPVVRSVVELRTVLDLLAANGLARGSGADLTNEAVEEASNGRHKGLKIHVMCELPTNAISADAFLEPCDGFSIGSNDLTQMTLGVDRDSGLVSNDFLEGDPSVKFLIQRAVAAARAAGKYCGICGQAPSDDPAFAEWLVSIGCGSISLNADAVLTTLQHIVAAEKKHPPVQ